MFSSLISAWAVIAGKLTAALKNKKQNCTIKLLCSHVHIISILINAHTRTRTHTHTHTHTHKHKNTHTNKVCLHALLSAGDGTLGSHSTQIDVSMLTDVTTSLFTIYYNDSVASLKLQGSCLLLTFVFELTHVR